ncbi:MAG: decarboxylating 6-phosphogluconate dehydrogenase [Thermoplasmata archaeon]|nr:decarboxylating 6-phosphogluconate dehydrogenase [Thermoplasmata archaeon]
MEVGMVGLGRMGANMAERLVHGGHRVVGTALHREVVDAAVARGIVGAYSLEELLKKLTPPRVIWLMIPAGDPVDATLNALLPQLGPGDLIVDGGNSYYKDTLRRSATLAAKGFPYVDVGTSGGIWGLAEGYSLMAGGPVEAVTRISPLLQTLAPAPDRGWGRVGPTGAGHFVKMVHNGIEYGMMQAYAEGFSILKHKGTMELDVTQVAEIWRFGSVVRSWLLDLTASALHENPELAGIKPFVVDSGEGRWTATEAFDLDVPAPVITLSLIDRIRSREAESFGDKLLAVMRSKFGGHAVEHEG